MAALLGATRRQPDDHWHRGRRMAAAHAAGSSSPRTETGTDIPSCSPEDSSLSWSRGAATRPRGGARWRPPGLGPSTGRTPMTWTSGRNTGPSGATPLAVSAASRHVSRTHF